MKTFKQILKEELHKEGNNVYDAMEYLVGFHEEIERAAKRYANQQTSELRARVLSYRHHYVTSFNLGEYDQHFGIEHGAVNSLGTPEK